jgi:hypothetical protein
LFVQIEYKATVTRIFVVMKLSFIVAGGLITASATLTDRQTRTLLLLAGLAITTVGLVQLSKIKA